MRSAAVLAFVVSAVALFGAPLVGQNAAPAPPPSTALTMLSADGRRPLAIVALGGQEFVSLDDLAAAFQLTVREEAGAITVSYKGRTIVLTLDQALVSVSGRLVSLPVAPARTGGRVLVPVEFINRALALVYDMRLELRRPSRLLIVGDIRVPRVTIRNEPLGNAARLTIDATPAAMSAITPESGRLTIKFDADAIDAAIPGIQPDGIVSAVRIPDAVTLAVDLGPRYMSYRASNETIDTTARLVIDLLSAQSDTVGAPAVPAPASPAPEPPPVLTPAGGIHTVAIDAGHGGEDEGAKGAEGTNEKTLALTVARRLKAAIEGRLGLRVIMTRDEDRNVPVDDRAAIANNNKADLFISLHANASFRPGANGASIHIAGFDDSEATRAALTPERVPAFGGGSRDIELVPWNLAQIRYADQSADLALMLEQQFQERIPLDPRPFSRGPLRVLESANMPAVLIEMGYLTNADQEKLLVGNEFQGTLVQAVVDVIVRFRDRVAATGAAQ